MSPPETVRGRPRDPALDEAVLAATVQLLGERGYRGLRVADVAHTARVGLGAVYRRWPSKRDLALAAIAQAVPDRQMRTTGDPARDVASGLLAVAAALSGPQGRLLASVLADLRDDPELASLVREQVLAPVRAEHRDRLHRLLGDRDDLNELADIGPAYLVFQCLFLGREVTTSELRRLLSVVCRQP
ncbi:MAG: TetR/AcrR family transcriptional regulator [Angustibacter sp.]